METWMERLFLLVLLLLFAGLLILVHAYFNSVASVYQYAVNNNNNNNSNKHTREHQHACFNLGTCKLHGRVFQLHIILPSDLIGGKHVVFHQEKKTIIHHMNYQILKRLLEHAK